MGGSFEKKKRQTLVRRILAWYQKNGRTHLPWRKTKDPYKILVSEIMLQQTQVDKVIPLYRNFIRLFPNFNALATAPTRDVILAWKGLGYNRRALYLQKTAQKIVNEFDGKLPQDPKKLQTLPGIGPYTVESLRAFVFHFSTAALDTNIRRVVGRWFLGVGETTPLREERLQKIAQDIVPKKRAYDWNSALMDFGSAICLSRRPLCEICPVQNDCRAYPKVLKPLARKIKRQEPAPRSTPHIPNRIYRGRVVELLRQAAFVNKKDIGPKIKTDFSQEDHVWLEKILKNLEQDGLVRIRGEKVSLP